MNAAARKWVKALLSGEFQQGQDQLRNDPITFPGDPNPGEPTYCCLGVACEIAKREGIIEDYDGSAGSLPSAVQEWLGMQDHEGDYHSSSLIHNNDSDGYSFARIARIIEDEAFDLFKEEDEDE